MPPPPPGLTPRQATALLLLRPQRRSPDEQRAVDQVHTVHPEVQTATALFDRFARLLRRVRQITESGPQAPPAPVTPASSPASATLAQQEQLAHLRQWIIDALRSGVAELTTFATKLRQDLPAVEAALTLPHSQGQTEGQITRLKVLKRQMFGRATFDLLRRRFLGVSAAPTAPAPS